MSLEIVAGVSVIVSIIVLLLVMVWQTPIKSDNVVLNPKKKPVIAVMKEDSEGVLLTREEFDRLDNLIRALKEPKTYNVRIHTSEGMIYCGYELHVENQTIDLFNTNKSKQYGYTTYNTPRTKHAYGGYDWYKRWGL